MAETPEITRLVEAGFVPRGELLRDAQVAEHLLYIWDSIGGRSVVRQTGSLSGVDVGADPGIAANTTALLARGPSLPTLRKDEAWLIDDSYIAILPTAPNASLLMASMSVASATEAIGLAVTALFVAGASGGISVPAQFFCAALQTRPYLLLGREDTIYDAAPQPFQSSAQALITQGAGSNTIKFFAKLSIWRIKGVRT